MFTGIIEEVGRIRRIEQKGENRRITIEARRTPKELKSGDSVAVSGVCLTALAIRQNSFSADLAPETWIRTSFSRVKPEALVNLELPMRVDGRLGGHLVQGHVDGVGKLIAFEPIPESIALRRRRNSETGLPLAEVPTAGFRSSPVCTHRDASPRLPQLRIGSGWSGAR